MIINTSALAMLFTGFKALFQGAFDGAPTQWERIAMTIPSSTSQEVYAWLGQFPGFREWLGDRVINNLKTHNYTIRNLTWENTVGVPRTSIEDDNYGVFGPMFQELGRTAKVHPDELVFALLAEGFASVCYDGKPFFAADHPVLDKDGVSHGVSNTGGGAGTPWYLLDTSRAVRPIILQKRRDYAFTTKDQPDDDNVFMRQEYLYGADARLNVGYGLWQLAYASKDDLDATNYGAARATMMSLKGDRGRQLGIKPNLLVVPPTLEGAGLEILNAERTQAGATNVYKGTAELMVCPWLA